MAISQSLNKLISVLNATMEEKDAEIADLKRQVTNKDNRMEYLDDLIKAQAKTIGTLEERLGTAPVTAQDWELKKEPATVSPGPNEDLTITVLR